MRWVFVLLIGLAGGCSNITVKVDQPCGVSMRNALGDQNTWKVAGHASPESPVELKFRADNVVWRWQAVAWRESPPMIAEIDLGEAKGGVVEVLASDWVTADENTVLAAQGYIRRGMTKDQVAFWHGQYPSSFEVTRTAFGEAWSLDYHTTVYFDSRGRVVNWFLD